MLSHLFIILSQFIGILSHWDYVTIFNKCCHNNEEFCRTRFFCLTSIIVSSVRAMMMMMMTMKMMMTTNIFWWFNDNCNNNLDTFDDENRQMSLWPQKTLGMCKVNTFWQFFIFFDRSTNRPTNQPTYQWGVN